MLHRLVYPLLGLSLLLGTAAFSSNYQSASANPDFPSYAKLVVTISGPPDVAGNYGWVWDAGVRRNGTPWIVTSGTLSGDRGSHADKSPNERIYWWITDKAWPNRVGPTEIEIMNAVGAQGWKLIKCLEGAQHSYVPSDFSFTTARTYVFMR